MGNKSFFSSNLSVIINYLKSDLIKKQRSFKIGLISIFLVVFFLTLLLNAIQLCPCIFIKLTEEQNSEIDLILTPYLYSQNVDIKKSSFDTFIHNKTSLSEAFTTNYKINFNFLDFYEIQKRLKNLSFLEGVTPRWIVQGKTSKKNEKKSSSEFLTNIFIIDSVNENDIGIGRGLNLSPLRENECYISTVLGNALKLNEGDTIHMDIRLWDLIQAFEGGSAFSESEEESKKKKSEIDRIKLKKKYEKEDEALINNTSLYDDIFDVENDFKKGIKFFTNNKINEVKNAMLNSKPIKEIINEVANEFINIFINENINKLLQIINEYYPNTFDLKDLSSFSMKKTDLINLKNLALTIPQISSVYNNIISNFTNQNNSRLKTNTNFLTNITNLILKQTFIYNETTDIIQFNKNILNLSSKENKTNYIKYNLDYHNILNQYKGEISEAFFEQIFQFSNFKLNLTVKEKISPSEGKWPSSSGNVLAIDCNHILHYLQLNGKRIDKEIIDTFGIKNKTNILYNYLNKSLKDFDLNKYALTVNAIFKDKFKIYTQSSKSMRYYMSKKVSEIIEALGSDFKVNINIPLTDNLINLEVITVFLQVIMFGIMAFLWILSVILVYSLMLGDVDERIYESSMLRALGFKKNNLTKLIIIQGLFFAIPGSLLGLTSSYIANNYIAYLFNSYTHLIMPFFLSKVNLIFGVVVGISIPLISSYFPIKKVLNSNLKENLSLFNKKIGEIVVYMIKLENIGISPTTLFVSIILINIGIFTYYVSPLSFIYLNQRLFLFIMLGILILMILGLIILSQLLIPHLQKLILKIIMFFFYKDRNLHLIILRNLDGHKRRDQQISLMFMIALGFVIFSGCTLNLVTDFVETMAKGLIGGDFMVGLIENNFNSTLNQTLINGYLNNITNVYPNAIQDYAYISYSSGFLLHTKNFELSPEICALNGCPCYGRKMYGIDRSFIDSTYHSNYMVSQYDKKLNISHTYDGKVDIIKMLYDNPSVPPLLQEKNDSFIFPVDQEKNLKFKRIFKNFQLNMIASEGIRKKNGISINRPGKFKINQYYEHNIPIKIVAMARKLPGFNFYSSYYLLAYSSEVYISMEHMKKLIDIETEFFNVDLGDYSNSTVDGIRKYRFILKYKDKVSQELKDTIFFAMNNHLNGVKYYILNLANVIETSEKIKKVIGYILLVLGIIALILSFFLIWISFYSNIRENITEYGILRSIGVTKKQSVRIYLYEAASILLSSIIIGTFIGIIISCSLILQFDIFLELPFIFHFPFFICCILVIIGIFLGLLGSYYPILLVNSLSLVKIMKGFNE